MPRVPSASPAPTAAAPRTSASAAPCPSRAGRVVIDHGLAYQGLVGLDLKILPYMDVRIVELGIGAISGVTNSPGSHLLESAGIGLVFHFPN